MQEIRGQSLREISQATASGSRKQSEAISQVGSERGKKGWAWPRTTLRHSRSVNSETPMTEESRTQGKNVQLQVNELSPRGSSITSTQAQVPTPGRSTDAAAIDKLYRLDFDEDDEIRKSDMV
jgi:hypothetical protein